MKTIAIIPSGGIGKRITSDTPKQYLKFSGKELIAYTLDVFQKSSFIDEIIIAVQPLYFSLLQEIKEKYGITKLSKLVNGGVERQHSVYNALQSANAVDNDIIVVHDAVRPLLPQEVLINAIDATKQFGASVVAISARDTLLKGLDTVHTYIDRNEMYYVQTPQCFSYKILSKAMEQANKENFLGTDESMLVHRFGQEIKIVLGSALNFKITTEDDIKIFSSLIDNRTSS
jgi:2-C-methyl-D-erythritol 4-phosphate cytidylyltransferase